MLWHPQSVLGFGLHGWVLLFWLNRLTHQG
jgi:hypothetical protein